MPVLFLAGAPRFLLAAAAVGLVESDPATTRFGLLLGRRLGGRDVTVLSTVRSLRRSSVGHDHGGETIEIVLEGLDVEGLDELVRAHLDRRLLLPGLIRLGRLSGGNPLARRSSSPAPPRPVTSISRRRRPYRPSSVTCCVGASRLIVGVVLLHSPPP